MENIQIEIVKNYTNENIDIIAWVTIICMMNGVAKDVSFVLSRIGEKDNMDIPTFTKELNDCFDKLQEHLETIK